jgi:hypothetical protein
MDGREPIRFKRGLNCFYSEAGNATFCLTGKLGEILGTKPQSKRSGKVAYIQLSDPVWDASRTIHSG